jgi:hypothetical protein
MGKSWRQYRDHASPYQELPPSSRRVRRQFKDFMIDLGAGLLSPLKALAGFAMALTPAADRANALAAQRGDNLVISASGEKLAIRTDLAGGIGKVDGNRISLNPGIEINGLKVTSGSLVKNESGEWQVEKLTFEITQFGSLPLNSKGFMEVDGKGNKTIVLPGESLGMKGATVRFDGGSGFYSEKGSDLYQIGAGTIERDGVNYQIQNLQLNRDKVSTIVLGAILTKDNQQFVMNTQGEIISTEALVQQVRDLGLSWKAVQEKVSSVESQLGAAYDDVTTKINAIASRFGAKGTFADSLDLSGARSARWQLAKVWTAVQEQGSYIGSMVQMVKAGRPDLAFSLMGTGGAGLSDLAKGVELIGQGINGFNMAAGKLVKSFELLNAYSANTTENGRTRVQDQVGLGKAYREFKSSLKILVLNPLTSDHVRGELKKLYPGAEALLHRPLDTELFKREERGSFKDLPSIGGSKPGITDWILHPRGTFLKVSASWMGLSPAKEASVNKLVAAIDLAVSLNPMDMGAKLGEEVTNKHLVEKSYVAAINFTEDLQKDATAPNADFQSQMASALNPVRFVERTYRWLEVNGDQPGSNLGAAGIFTLGIAMTAFEVENPIAIVAKVMPTIVQRNVNNIGEVAGWSRESTEKWGERIGTVASVATFAAGGFKEPPSLAEFGIKTAAFYGSAVAVTEGSKYAVTHWNIGGNDKELANEIVQSMINGGMMVGGKYASKAAKALEVYAGEKSNQIIRFGLKADRLTAKREVLVQESLAVDQQIQIAKTDLAVETSIAREIESLSNIQKNNAPEGAQSGTRPIRSNAGAGPKLDQGSDLSVLLQEAQRAGEAQRGVGRRVSAAEEGIRLLEGRKQSIGSEIRRTDSQIETARGARAKAESVVYKTVVAPTAGGIGLRIFSLFAQSDEPLFERSTPSTVLNPAPTGNKGFFQSVKELVSNERGSILVEPPPIKEFYANLKNKLFGKVSPNSSAEGPPVGIEKAKAPLSDHTSFQDPANSLGFKNGRPLQSQEVDSLPGRPRGPTPNESSPRYIYDGGSNRFRDTTTGKYVSQKDLPFPTNRGFVWSEKAILPVGKIVDRFGPSGRYAGDVGSSLSERGLPPGSESMGYRKFEVIKPFEVERGPSAPVPEFGASGGKTQYYFSKSTEKLLAEGYLREIK